MAEIRKIKVCTGVFWVEFPDAGLRVLCGCPADAVKHLMRRGLVVEFEQGGVKSESGPNAILLSEVMVQGGDFANQAEFPVLQMLYRQGMIVPGHPNNTGAKPLLIGSPEQIDAQINYIHRGNYGLVSTEEMIAAGCDADQAAEFMRMKLRFAFGQIRPPSDLLDTLEVTGKGVEIRDGVTIRRRRLNVYQFTFEDQSVTVDLNLDASEKYEPPYPLGYHQIERGYFSVIHSGEGDGWDINRPCMGSIVSFQGRLYLVDAGPNLHATLTALGIGVNELDGIFHTHAHDDHFSGLTTLMRSDHRLKYFATPLVRSSVTKKLSSLLTMDENRFSSYFDIIDLKPDEWNDIDGLEVKPINSPHPVETTIFLFRSFWEGGYRSYGHFADIASFDVLGKMVTEDADAPGITPEFVKKVKAEYHTPTTLKKLDIGGGMIHGEAADFRGDQSEKIILSHVARPLSPEEKEIGSGAPLGTTDILIPSYQTYVRRFAFRFLKSYFPNIPNHSLHTLLNNEVDTFNPEAILVRQGDEPQHIFLILTGSVEMITAGANRTNQLSAGALVGELSGLHGLPSGETYRAFSFVKALRIPVPLYSEFVRQNDLFANISALAERREFLHDTWLFGEELSYPIQNKIAKVMTPVEIADGKFSLDGTDGSIFSLYVVQSGLLKRFINDSVLETLRKGDFFGEEVSLFGEKATTSIRSISDAELFEIPIVSLSDIPVVRWKLFETHQKRKRMQIGYEVSNKTTDE
ncbi:MAG: cyclic nucleotide-binding domain-containing protein [Rhodospirillales bacterium]|nr:cyclic nucleotide-binding domain-containing protein [Rhodospirillales bacterium]